MGKVQQEQEFSRLSPQSDLNSNEKSFDKEQDSSQSSSSQSSIELEALEQEKLSELLSKIDQLEAALLDKDLNEIVSISQDIIKWKKNLQLNRDEDKDETTHLGNVLGKSKQQLTKCVDSQTAFTIQTKRNESNQTNQTVQTKSAENLTKRQTNVPQPKRSTYYGSPDRSWSPNQFPNLRDSYECIHCTKSYKRENALEDHMDFIHRGIIKYKCDFEGCGSTFQNKRSLSGHVKKRHGVNQE